MDPEHRNLISANLTEISELIDADLLKACLLEKQIFTGPMIEDIYRIERDTERKHLLLTELQTRGPYAFEKFIGSLELTGLDDAAALLKSCAKIPCPNEAIVRDSENGKSPIKGQNVINFTEECEFNVISAKEWQEGPEIYKMTSDPRGCCLIINNINFQGLNEERVGSDKDAIALDKVFRGLGYYVYIKKNLTRDEMLKKLTLFTKKIHLLHEEQCNVDSSVVIILSHGTEGGVYGVDGMFVSIKEILVLFDNYNCPYMRRKPKLFFFQSCQGNNFDCGVPLFETTDAVVSNEFKTQVDTSIRLPSLCDVFISLSSVAGYRSVRTNHGSWYCQELARALAKYACEMDLESILKRVDAEVQKKISFDGLKQATENSSKGWCKKLYFNPGLVAKGVE